MARNTSAWLTGVAGALVALDAVAVGVGLLVGVLVDDGVAEAVGVAEIGGGATLAGGGVVPQALSSRTPPTTLRARNEMAMHQR